MTPQELANYATEVAARHVAAMVLVDEVEAASAETASIDHRSDGLAEAIFLRCFIAYEADIEALFLHYVTGGASQSGVQAVTYLNITDVPHARKIIKAGYKFLGWSKPSDIRTTASTYIKGGWPLVDMMATKEQILTDSERIRNRIAHNSLEAKQQFGIVQRNYLRTERLFPLTPGQFLRIRSSHQRKIYLAHFLEAMNQTLEVLIDPLA